jgi:hypothetical protein
MRTAQVSSKSRLEKVLQDTHKSPDRFIELFGENAASKFVSLFEPKLCDGMELPISEAFDALNSVVDVCEIKEPMLSHLLRKSQDPADIKSSAQTLVVRIIDLAQTVGDQSIDSLNDLMRLFRGFGVVADEFGGKMDEYFQSGPSVIGFFNRTANMIEKHITSRSDEDPADGGMILKEFLAGAVKFSSSMKVASDHLSVMEGDIKSRD